MKWQQCLILIILCIVITGCKDKPYNHGVLNRPENFPEILLPLHNAANIRYASPETSKIAEGTYSISFQIDEKYPAESTIKLIQDYLKKQGCVRVKWAAVDFSVSNINFNGDTGKRTYTENWQETQEIRNALKKSEQNETRWKSPPSETVYAKIIYAKWTEEWIAPNDDLISVVLQYDLPRKENDEMLLYVKLYDFTSSSWRYPYVKKYKERHPEQFPQSSVPEYKKQAPMSK